MKNGDMPAMPMTNERARDSWFKFNNEICPDGLTKREYFAGLAMQGLMASPLLDGTRGKELIPRFAVEYADALLAQLNKEAHND